MEAGLRAERRQGREQRGIAEVEARPGALAHCYGARFDTIPSGSEGLRRGLAS